MGKEIKELRVEIVGDSIYATLSGYDVVIGRLSHHTIGIVGDISEFVFTIDAEEEDELHTD